MDPTIPVFSFDTPWVALIQIALLYVLPRVTGLIVSQWATGITKTAALGALTVIGSGLTWLLGVAMANTWATVDWTDGVQVLINALITWAIGSRVFDNVIAKQESFDPSAGLNLFENTAKVAKAVAGEKALARGKATVVKKAVG